MNLINDRVRESIGFNINQPPCICAIHTNALRLNTKRTTEISRPIEETDRSIAVNIPHFATLTNIRTPNEIILIKMRSIKDIRLGDTKLPGPPVLTQLVNVAGIGHIHPDNLHTTTLPK